jgi:hypothetical protein
MIAIIVEAAVNLIQNVDSRHPVGLSGISWAMMAQTLADKIVLKLEVRRRHTECQGISAAMEGGHGVQCAASIYRKVGIGGSQTTVVWIGSCGSRIANSRAESKVAQRCAAPNV